MFKKSYYWVFGIGIILICVGVTVLVRVEAARDDAAMPQNLRVAEAVVQLDGCLTCHIVTGDAPLWLHGDAGLLSGFEHTHIAVPESRPREAVQRTPLETRLLSVGQRILALPESNTAQAEPVVSGFLHIYEQTRIDDGQAADQMSALATLEFWLRNLEYQTQTGRWNRAEDAPSQPDLVVWQTVFLASGYAVAAVSEQVCGLADMARSSCPLWNDELSVPLVDVVFGVHHRGPPMGVVIQFRLV
jgi:hypothetical protein